MLFYERKKFFFDNYYSINVMVNDVKISGWMWNKKYDFIQF